MVHILPIARTYRAVSQHALQYLTRQQQLQTLALASATAAKHQLHSLSQPHATFASIPAANVGRRRFELRKAADVETDNARRQAEYYRLLLNEGNYYEICSRHNTGRYATNAEVQQIVDQADQMLNPQSQSAPQYSNSAPYQQQQYMQPPPQAYAQPQQQQPQQSRGFFGRMFGRGAAQQSPNYTPGTASAGNSSSSEPVRVSIVQTGTGARDEFIRGMIRFGFSAVLIVFILSIMSKQMSGLSAGGGGMFKEPKAVSQIPTTRFNDVRGCNEAKEELQELVAYLKNPEQFSRLGGKMPKGILMLGPPGTGKTLLARAVAGEAGVSFFACSGSEFEEMFVGVGARRIRDLFAAAKKKSPAIIFIDEIDAVGGKRSSRDHQSARASMNELLTQLDGFQENSGVIVIGATNFAKALDPALTRPGRFDRHVNVSLPDVLGRKSILELYAAKVPMSSDVDLGVLARGTPGCSGADLYNLINSAAIRASTTKQANVTMKDLEWAKDKVLMGAERTNAGKTPEAVRLTAFHEAGHALVGIYTPGAMPIHKMTVLPRGQSLGMTHFLPENDMDSRTKREMLASMDVCMGGRVAEELIAGADNVTTGASSDLEQATRTARAMLMSYGMGNVGLMSVSDPDQLSAEQKKKIDAEVNHLLEESYKRAKNLLTSKKQELDALALALLKHETLSGVEIKQVIEGKKELPNKPISHPVIELNGSPIAPLQ